MFALKKKTMLEGSASEGYMPPGDKFQKVMDQIKNIDLKDLDQNVSSYLAAMEMQDSEIDEDTAAACTRLPKCKAEVAYDSNRETRAECPPSGLPLEG